MIKAENNWAFAGKAEALFIYFCYIYSSLTIYLLDFLCK